MKWLLLIVLLAAVLTTGCTLTCSRIEYEGKGTAVASLTAGGIEETSVEMPGGVEGGGPIAAALATEAVVAHDEGRSVTTNWQLEVKSIAVLVLSLIFFPF